MLTRCVRAAPEPLPLQGVGGAAPSGRAERAGPLSTPGCPQIVGPTVAFICACAGCLRAAVPGQLTAGGACSHDPGRRHLLADRLVPLVLQQEGLQQRCGQQPARCILLAGAGPWTEPLVHLQPLRTQVRQASRWHARRLCWGGTDTACRSGQRAQSGQPQASRGGAPAAAPAAGLLD